MCILLNYIRNVSYVSYVSLFTRAARHVFCIYFTFLILNYFIKINYKTHKNTYILIITK